MINKQSVMIIVLQIIVVSLFQVSIAQEQIDFESRRCAYSDNMTTTTYQDNIVSVLAALTNQSSTEKFFETFVGNGSDRVNAFYVCRPDLSLETCNACLKENVIGFKTLCSIQMEATAWYQECIVRYSNETIFATLQTEPDRLWFDSFNVTQPDIFPGIVNNTLKAIIKEASLETNLDRFAHNSTDYTTFEGFYGMAWCTPDIEHDECSSCLTTALERIPNDRIAQWSTVLLPSCVLKYDTAPFIFPASPPAL